MIFISSIWSFTYLVQFVYRWADGPELVLGHSTCCEHAVQYFTVIYLQTAKGCFKVHGTEALYWMAFTWDVELHVPLRSGMTCTIKSLIDPHPTFWKWNLSLARSIQTEHAVTNPLHGQFNNFMAQLVITIYCPCSLISTIVLIVCDNKHLWRWPTGMRNYFIQLDNSLCVILLPLTLITNSPKSKPLSISATIFMHSASGSMAS